MYRQDKGSGGRWSFVARTKQVKDGQEEKELDLEAKEDKAKSPEGEVCEIWAVALGLYFSFCSLPGQSMASEPGVQV